MARRTTREERRPKEEWAGSRTRGLARKTRGTKTRKEELKLQRPQQRLWQTASWNLSEFSLKASTKPNFPTFFRHRYSSYQRNFFFLETLNIFTLLLSFGLTHWILNYKFWRYGKEVVEYLTKYGQYEYTHGKKLHDPMCELFPTEVNSAVKTSNCVSSSDFYIC